MEYRLLGNTGQKISRLGMGCMRLPFVDNDGNKGVDREAAVELIQYAADHGINYFDTAFAYHSYQGETYVGEALEGRRKDVIITTKQPLWEMPNHASIRKNLESTLKKLRTDYIDNYFIHRIMPSNWQQIQERKIYEEFMKFKAEGLIKHIGFSYHGNLAHFKEVVQAYPWALCMVQHNMLDIHREVTAEGVHFAAEQGLGVMIMEPLRGGGLCYAPTPVKAVYDAAGFTHRTPTEWALRYLVDFPQITGILSGMSTMEQLKANLSMFNQPDMTANCLSDAEKKVISDARKAYESIITIPCTACNYCIPCPFGVQIPTLLGLYNDAHRFGHWDQPRRGYLFAKNANGAVNQCVSCGVCNEKCPQEIDIVKQLHVVQDALDGWKE